MIPGVRQLFKKLFSYASPSLEKEVFGIKFPGPIGLAAGFDKNAKLIEPLSAMGFGFIEVGTVTPRAQSGNPLPRLFRLPNDRALINRMGFNNEGVDEVVKRLKNRSSSCVIGGNIGKNKDTPNETAFEDYLYCFRALYPWVDYFVVNVSSPNTPGLRELQEKEPLMKLLNKLQKANHETDRPKPVLLKIAPDLTNHQLDDIIEIVLNTKLSGLVATNTTVERTGLKTEAKVIDQKGQGGLSGDPLTDRSTEVIRYLNDKCQGTIPIIGVGGISSPEDVIQKLEAGASLVQVYTGFIYQGPSMIKKLSKSLDRQIAKSR